MRAEQLQHHVQVHELHCWYDVYTHNNRDFADYTYGVFLGMGTHDAWCPQPSDDAYDVLPTQR